jgi:type I restriction enzyme S subunit
LGLIPHGWRVGSIADILQLSNETITPGSTPDVEFFHYSIPAYDNGRVPSLDLGASILSNKFRVRNNSILVSKLNPRIPRIWAIQTADEKRSICSTEFQVFLSQKPYLYAFGLNLFGQESIVEIMKSRASGTSGSHQRVKPQDILDIQIVLPSDDVLKVYEQTVGSYSQFIEDCLDESATLATLRDALLPKLMSGEIDV